MGGLLENTADSKAGFGTLNQQNAKMKLSLNDGTGSYCPLLPAHYV